MCKKEKEVLGSDDLLCTKRPEISPTRASLRGQPRSVPKVSSPVRSILGGRPSYLLSRSQEHVTVASISV